MKRDRSNDTQPMRSAEPTDPGGFRPPERNDLPVDAERERMEQLIAAFDRPPKRPSPNYAERPYSSGGNAVGYSAMVTPSPARGERHQERVLVDLAELTRHANLARARTSNTGRDDTTVSPARDMRARSRLWLAVGASAALAVAGIASVHAGSSRVSPAARPTVGETPSGSPATPVTSAHTAMPNTVALPAQPMRPAPAATTAPSLVVPAPASIRTSDGTAHGRHSFPAPAKPDNDPTLERLDRVP